MATATAAAEKKLACCFCAYEYPASAGREHGRKFCCTPCGNADRQLRRNLGTRPEEVAQFSAEDTVSFFRALHAKKGTDAQLMWKTVRATLITCVVERNVTRARALQSGEFLPLSVWESRGWDPKVVEKQESEWREDLQLWTYNVPIKTLTWEQVHERIEESILKHEREAQKKKGAAKDLDVPVAAAGGTEKEPKSEAAAQKKMLRENEKTYALAAKGVGVLTKPLTQLQKLSDKVESSELVPEGTKTAFQDLKNKLEDCAQQARSVVNLHEAQKHAEGTVAPLPSLPFVQSDLKAFVQQTAAVTKEVRDSFPKKPKGTKRGGEDQPAAGAPKRRRQKSAA